MLTIFKVFFAELVALLHREGKTASSFLQELYERYVSIECGVVSRLCQSRALLDTVTSRSVSFSASQHYVSSLLSDQQQLFHLRRPACR